MCVVCNNPLDSLINGIVANNSVDNTIASSCWKIHLCVNIDCIVANNNIDIEINVLYNSIDYMSVTDILEGVLTKSIVVEISIVGTM